MKKSGSVILAAVLIFSLLLSGCGGSKSGSTSVAITPAEPRGNTGTITIGKMVAAAHLKVPSSGGTIKVTEAGTPITGLELTVPSGSYKDSKNFTVSYAPVEKHSFGEDFDPITPLIKVENGGDYSNEIMEVKIPVQVPDDYFAMGFLYNEADKTLEGMPLIAKDDSSITVGTRHFSSFLISMIPLVKLKKDIDSGFRPGIDDWQFCNYGSFLEPKGHCAGQSVSALWYYFAQPDGRDLTLYGRYDNNSDQPATPRLWQDDSRGYRLASVVQDDIKWNTEAVKWQSSLARSGHDEVIYHLFAYSMQMTGQPQYTGIYSDAGGGHAMIVYRIFKNALYIADPNYPGNTERRIEYSSGQFTPYNSGENAAEIADGKGKAYEHIGYFARTSIIDNSRMANRWKEFKDAKIGEGTFPAYQIVRVDKQNMMHELTDGYISSEKLIDIGAVAKSSWIENEDLSIVTYRDGNALNFDADGNYELLPGVNQLGIYIMGLVEEKDKKGNIKQVNKYIDFKYFNVIYGGLSIEPSSLEGQTNTQYTFTAKAAAPPAGAIYDWYIDKQPVLKGTSSVLTRSFPSEGDYAVSLKLLDSSGKVLAEAGSTAKISAKKSTAPASGIQNSKYLSWHLSVGTTWSYEGPKKDGTESSNLTLGTNNLSITWNGNTFTCEEKGADYTHTITGTVSEDGSKLLKFEEKNVGSRKTGDSYYDLVLSDIPLSRLSSGGYGYEHEGADVLGYITKYEQNYTQLSAATGELNFKAELTSVDKADKIKLKFSETTVSSDY